MKTFVAWVSVVAATLLFLSGGWWEPTWPIGFDRAGEMFLSGCAASLLSCFAPKLVHEAGRNVEFPFFMIFGFAQLVVLALALLVLLTTTISGTIAGHPTAVAIAIIFSPSLLIWLPFAKHEGWC